MEATLGDVLTELRKLRDDLRLGNITPEKLLTAWEAAEYLGVSVVTIRRWEKAGKLKGRGVGKSKRYTHEDLMRVA